MRRRALYRSRDYRLLWGGQSASGVGDAFSGVALPLLAIQTLHVSALQSGALRAAEQVAALASVPLGVAVDRLRRRRLMVWTDGLRCLATVLVAVVAFAGLLSYGLLVAAALAMGLLDSLFVIAYTSHLPDVLEEDQRIAGTAQLGTGKFGALTAGYALGGLLVAAVGAARALLADAGSFVISAVSLLLIRRPDPIHARTQQQPAAEQNWRGELATGARLVLADRRLGALATAMAGVSFAMSFSIAVEMLFLVQDLHASATAIGLVYGLPVAAGVPGSWLSVRLMRRLGPAGLMRVAGLVYAPAMAVPAFAPSGGLGLVLTGGAWTVLVFAASASNAANNVLRQQLTTPATRGRVNAFIRTMTSTAKLVALVLGGVLGELLGLRGALLASALAVIPPTLLVLSSASFRGADRTEVAAAAA